MSHVLDRNLLTLQQKTGYTIVQENGQRKTGPPPFWKGPPPPKGCEIFIGKLPRNIFEDELFPLFQNAGVIYEFRMMMDFSSSNRGFAFVTYSSKTEAQRAIKMLNGFEIRPGRRIGVLKSVDNCRLYIGGIPAEKCKEEVLAEISKYTSGVSDVFVHISPINMKNRGFAFIEYVSHRAASMARKILIPGNVKLFDCEITVDWATPVPDVDEDHMKLVTILYVRNIPQQISEGYLLYLFTLQGKLAVHRIKKIKDFAFVHYFTRHEAEIALSKLNGMNLNGSCIEVTWAKPPCKLPENYELSNITEHKLYMPNTLGCFASQDKQSSQDSRISSAKVLSIMCQENGWGEPVFHITHTSSSIDDSETTFAAKVYIPNLPCLVKYFVPPGIFFSPKEAKNCAADCALQHVALLNKSHSFPATSFEYYRQLQTNSNFGGNHFLDSSNIWNPNQDNVPTSENMDFLDQDSFFTLLSSAASLANAQLQTNTKMAEDFRSESMN